MRQTEEGNELHTRLRGTGLSWSEIRIVWKRLHMVPWAEIAEAGSAIEDLITPGTLSMRLLRLKDRHPYLKELFPSRIRAEHRRVRSPDNGTLPSHERRRRRKHRHQAQNMMLSARMPKAGVAWTGPSWMARTTLLKCCFAITATRQSV